MENMISVRLATAIGLGAIIGSGIFILSGTAIALAGVYSLIAFVIVGIVAIAIALQVGALSKTLPHVKGAAYSYAYKAFGSELGFVTGILQYFGYCTSVSAIVIGFGSYLTNLLGMQNSADSMIFAIALIALLGAMNMLGIKKAAKADFLLVTIKLLVLMVFVAFAILFALSHASQISTNFDYYGEGGIAGVLASIMAIIFAYSGFQVIATLTDRIKGGPGSASKAILYAVVISLVVYVLVIMALMLLAPAGSYTISADPFVSALTNSHAPGWLFAVVDVGAIVATASASLAMLLSASRVLYQMGVDHLLPKIIRKYSVKRDSAQNAILLSCVLAVIMLFSGNIYVIAAISNFSLIFSYIMVSLAGIHFRKLKGPEGFKVPFYPYLPILTIIVLLVFFYGMPQESLVIGTIMLISIVLVYYVLREVKHKRVVRVKLFN